MRFTLFFLSLVLCIGCKTEKKAPKEDIASLEAKLAQEHDPATLKSLLALYKEEAVQASDGARIDLLWKAGETARALQDFTEAESLFKEIYEKYPQSEQASKALFIHAFMCDEDLKQFDKAKSLYQSFLDKYPTSDFSDDAEILLEHLGKSDEEMLELLSKQNTE